MSKFEWRFSVTETIGFGVGLATISVAITLWSISTFQTKEAAASEKAAIEVRLTSAEAQIGAVDSKVDGMRSSIESVAKDVSYIRGRLEQQSRGEK